MTNLANWSMFFAKESVRKKTSMNKCSSVVLFYENSIEKVNFLLDDHYVKKASFIKLGKRIFLRASYKLQLKLNDYTGFA